MSGVAAYRRSEFKFAVSQWVKLLLLLEPGSPDAQQVETDIADARAKGGLQGSGKPTSLRQGAGAEVGKLPPVDPAAAAAMTPEQINLMVDRLAAKQKANPGDLEGWVRLARAYKVQGRLPEAEAAFDKAGKLVEGNADLLTQYADLVATRAGSLQGKPTTLVNKALAINPLHPMALMLAGSAAYQRADYPAAVTLWERALAVVPVGSRDSALLTSEIADARAKGGIGLQLKAKP